MSSPIHIFLLHSYRTFADCLTIALEQRSEVTLVGSARDLREAWRKLRRLDVEILLFEAELDRAEIHPRIRRLRKELPEIKILPLGVESTREFVEMVEAGAYGCLARSASLTKLIRTLQDTHRERPRCPPTEATRILEQVQDLAASLAEGDGEPEITLPEDVDLTHREQEILEFMHLPNKEIASTLRISNNTVKIHVHNILDKFKVENRVHARERARELGILPKDPYG